MSDDVQEYSPEPAESSESNKKHRISSEPVESQGESQQSAASIDQEFGCGICLETMITPYTSSSDVLGLLARDYPYLKVVLPCLHTFCKACLTEWWKKNSNCPTCKKTSTSAKSAFQLKAIMDRVHKNRRKRRKLSSAEGTTFEEIFPLTGGHPALNYDNDDDLASEDDESGEGSEVELDDDFPRGDGLVWPCIACIPNNQTGYTCPTPIPSPTDAEIQSEQARRPTWAPVVSAPLRGDRRMSLNSAVENAVPGASDHSICVRCGTYVPNGFPRAIKCGGCSEAHCNNFDPAGCPSGVGFHPRDEVHLTPDSTMTLTTLLPNLVMHNLHEVSRFSQYATARNISARDIIKALFQAKRDQVAEDTNEEAADENWGPDAWFCDRCVRSITASMLWGWWVKERRASLGRQDGIVPVKPDCWYGRECRTQTHNDSHAARLNHVCENTRLAGA